MDFIVFPGVKELKVWTHFVISEGLFYQVVFCVLRFISNVNRGEGCMEVIWILFLLKVYLEKFCFLDLAH